MTEPASPVSGFDELVFSVFDIDRASAAMVDVGGWRRHPTAPLPRCQLTAWDLPEEATGSQALLVPPDGMRGRLRLVSFEGVPRELIRPSQRVWDSGGIFDIDLFTSDVRGRYRALQARHGWTGLGEPVDYVIGPFDVTQVVAVGPDGLMLALIEPRVKDGIDLPADGAFSRAFNSTQLVRDMDAALDFYCRRLGWRQVMRDEVVDVAEPGANVLGLPMPHAVTTRRRVAIVHPEGLNDGSVELMQIVDMTGEDRGARCVPPNVGLLAVRFPVTDARAEARRLADAGVDLARPLHRFDMHGVGEVLSFGLRSPDGAILEFYELLDRSASVAT